MMEHPENYRWSNIGRSRFDTIRINVELASGVVHVKRYFKDESKPKVKIAPRISHTVYPTNEK